MKKPKVIVRADGSREIHYETGVFKTYDKDGNKILDVNCPYIPQWMAKPKDSG